MGVIVVRLYQSFWYFYSALVSSCVSVVSAATASAFVNVFSCNFNGTSFNRRAFPESSFRKFSFDRLTL